MYANWGYLYTKCTMQNIPVSLKNGHQKFQCLIHQMVSKWPSKQCYHGLYACVIYLFPGMPNFVFENRKLCYDCKVSCDWLLFLRCVSNVEMKSKLSFRSALYFNYLTALIFSYTIHFYLHKFFWTIWILNAINAVLLVRFQNEVK